MAITNTLQQVEALYIGYFGRAGEPAGTNYWVGQVNSGFSLANAAASFSVQPEAKGLYPYLNTPLLVSPADFVTEIYQNLFNRLPDDAGKAYWVAQLTANQGSPAFVGTFILSVINGAYGPGGDPKDAAKIDNKIATAEHFTSDLAIANISGTEVVNGVVTMTTEALVAAKAAVGPAVTENPATVTTANAASDAFVAGGVTGEVFVLQPGIIEDLTGTSGNDTFIGSDASLTTDVINGLGGIDTLRVTGAKDFTAIPTLSNVEHIEVTGLTPAGASTINLINATGVTQLASTNGTSDVVFTNVKAIADLKISNVTGGAQTVIYTAAVVAGAKDTQKIAFDNATSGAVTVNGIETMDVTATGTNIVDSLASNKLTTVNIGGAGSLTVKGTALIGATTVDASANKGGVKIGLDITKDVTVTGGSGNDVFNFGTGLTTNDKINGGDGHDLIRISNQASLPVVKLDITSIEGLQIDQVNAAAAVNVDLLGGALDLIRFGNNGLNQNGLLGAAAITNGLNNTTIEAQSSTNFDGSVTFGLKSDTPADVLTLKLVNTNTGGFTLHGIDTFTANTVDTLKIDASNLGLANTADTLHVLHLNAIAATSLTITGDSAVQLGFFSSSLTSLSSVDASTMTKGVMLGGAAAFNTSAVGATITTGSGNDSVFLDVGAGTGALKAINLGAEDTSVAGGGGDTLHLTGGTPGAVVTLVDLSAADQVSQLLGVANTPVQSGIEHIDLSGLAGSAVITGSSGNNTITGTAGADIITGGAGADILSGSGGFDTFKFATKAETQGIGWAPTNTTIANIDHITDFFGNGGAAGDTIQFGTGANAFGGGLTFTGATTVVVTAVAVAAAGDFTALAAAIQTASAGVASSAATAHVYDVTVGAGNLAGHYLVLNDNNGAIQASDTFISIAGGGPLNPQDFIFA